MVLPNLGELSRGTSTAASPRGRDPRIGLGLLALSVVAVVALAAEHLASGSTQLWLAHGGWTASALVAVASAAAATRGSAGTDRPGWALLLGGCVAWLAGEAFWSVYSATSYPGSPNPAEICWLGFAVAAAAGVHRLCRGGSRSLGISLLEVAPLIAAATALIVALLAGSLRTSQLSGAGQVTAVAYPVLYVSAALVMAQAVLAGGLDLRHNRGLAGLLCGLAVEGIGFMLWSPQLLGGTYAVGATGLDAVWSAGMILIGWGAWTSSPMLARPKAETVSRRRDSLLPALTFVILAVTQAMFSGGESARERILGVGVSIVGMTLIVHAMVSRRRQAVLVRALHARERELDEANTLLKHQSRTDALTGLANRLRLREDFADLQEHEKRYGHGYSLVLIDLDHFKQYNDHHGHQAGDLVLARVADLITGSMRASDRAYRYGGEEILLLLRGQDLHTSVAVAERYRTELNRQSLPHPQNPPHGLVTLSAGVAAARTSETPEQVLHQADDALYEAKALGRNRVAAAAQAPNHPPSALTQT